MNPTSLEIAKRLIARDEAIRNAGKSPAWNSVRRIVEYVADEHLLRDSGVLAWLCRIVLTTDSGMSHRLLKTVEDLLDEGGFDEAHTLYRCILGLDDSTRWEKLAPLVSHQSLVSEAAFNRVLCRADLLAAHPLSWGATASELLARVVVEHQRREWPSNLRLHAVVAKQFGEAFDENAPFVPELDDSPGYWFFGRDGAGAPRNQVARAVNQGLSDALQLDEASVFVIMADQLLQRRYSIGAALIFSVLLDGVTGKVATKPWHVAEAIRILSLDTVQEHTSISDFRRSLRAALPGPLDPTTAAALSEVIRRSDPTSPARLQELADVESWGVLLPEEKAEVDSARERGELRTASDVSREPVVVRREDAPSPFARRSSGWPHPEDEEAIELLSAMRAEADPNGALEGVVEDLQRRAAALSVILTREECKSERWFGEILGWCERAIKNLRRYELSQLNRDERTGSLTNDEWLTLLAVRAPWWKDRAEKAIARLAEPVPSYHRDRHSDGLSWGSADPVYQSFQYLDEVLAVEGGEPFSGLRGRMEDAVDGSWNEWPSFTRATALSVIRTWYWYHLPKLRARLSQVAEQESDGLVVKYAVEIILKVGGPNLARHLEAILQRTESFGDAERIVDRIGSALGDCLILRDAEAHAAEAVTALAALCERLQHSPPRHPTTLEQLIKGLLWGAGDCVANAPARSEKHVEAWLAIVGWASSAWPWSITSTRDEERFPLFAITLVLEKKWPEALRRRLFDGLAGTFHRILHDGSLADFSWGHYELKSLLEKGDTGMSDEFLLSMCRLSAERVVAWFAEGKRTNDLGWGSGLTGHDTADLIRAALSAARDRDYLRRELPTILDRLSGAGAKSIATELRIHLRRI